MSGTSPPPPPNNPDPTLYWCYHCNKRVPVLTLSDVISCSDCSNGFVESIPVIDDEETPAFSSDFLHILRLIALAAPEHDHPSDQTQSDGGGRAAIAINRRNDQLLPPPPSDRFQETRSDRGGGFWGSSSSRIIAAREGDEPPPPLSDRSEETRSDRGGGGWGSSSSQLIAMAAREDDEPPPPPSDRPYGDNDYLRIELDRWNNEDDDDDDDEDEEGGDDEHSINNYGDDDLVEQREELRFRLRDIASRAASRRNRILDWAEILMGLEDQSFRLQVVGYDDDDDGGGGYVGDPGDYVDAAGYEALLETLAESDGGRRGAPPAAKTAVEGLLTVEVKSSDMEVCAICKDRVFNCEGKVVKQLECGHMYHGECIVCWLDVKNSCPVCRFELPTDDPEYEEDRKKRLVTVATAAAAGDGGCSSSSHGAD